MSLQDINELLDKYDKLRSVANSGSSDKRITSKYKRLRRIFEYKLLKNFSINMYVVPFASNQIRKEIRSTLINILKLHEINYWRTERKDISSKEIIDTVNEYLKEIPKHGISLADRLEKNSLNILGVAIGILSLILSSWSTAIPFVLLVIGVILVGPFVGAHLAFIGFRYFFERRWYKEWMRKLAIEDLKRRIVKELVELNDKTYTKLDTKYN